MLLNFFLLLDCWLFFLVPLVASWLFLSVLDFYFVNVQLLFVVVWLLLLFLDSSYSIAWFLLLCSLVFCGVVWFILLFLTTPEDVFKSVILKNQCEKVDICEQ